MPPKKQGKKDRRGSSTAATSSVAKAETFSEVTKGLVRNTATVIEPVGDIQIIITKNEETEIEFELIGANAPIANTLRRVMMESVPTVAIEDVTINSNTGVLQSENLAHRLGLIPLAVDPNMMEGGPKDKQEKLQFLLDIKATKPNQPVYSGDLQWIALEGQEEKFGSNPPRPVDPQILITKISPPDNIQAVCTAIKGCGSTHAKFSPVSPAYYRMHPEISFVDAYGAPTRFEGAEAETLASRCPGKVFDIEDGIAKVARPRNCTMCRECIREEDWAPRVRLGVRKTHFIFSVETTGVLSPETVVKTALRIFKEKLELLKRQVKEKAKEKEEN
eukprot:TRINITY_DN68118_c4_g3_i1.p1 TRINITY_DN68118_c4_g3~~TRINITY_DN68118_c4_g3_i1.p1  ORF type:complete len:344 (+),score=54.66 TRINITY_DN68118_c4_g3_i1:36-1034(+)